MSNLAKTVVVGFFCIYFVSLYVSIEVCNCLNVATNYR